MPVQLRKQSARIVAVESKKRRDSKTRESARDRSRSRSPAPPVGKAASKANQWVAYQHKLAVVTMILPKEDPKDDKEPVMCRIIYPAVDDVKQWEEPAGPVRLSRCKITALPSREYRLNLRKAMLKIKLKKRNAEKEGEMVEVTGKGRRSLIHRVSDDIVEILPSGKKLNPKLSEDGIAFDDDLKKQKEKDAAEDAARKLAEMKIRKSMRGKKKEESAQKESAPVAEEAAEEAPVGEEKKEEEVAEEAAAPAPEAETTAEAEAEPAEETKAEEEEDEEGEGEAAADEEKEDAAPKEVAPPQLDWTEEELQSKFDDKFNSAMNDIMLELVSRTDDFTMNCYDVLKEAEIAGIVWEEKPIDRDQLYQWLDENTSMFVYEGDIIYGA